MDSDIQLTPDDIALSLGEAMVSDSGIPENWKAIVAVFKVQPGTVGGWTEYYLDDDKAHSTYFEDGETTPLVNRLHALTQVEGEPPWVACKVTIDRDGTRMNIQFEYTDPKRWDTPLPF